MSKLQKFKFTPDAADILANCKEVTIPESRSELVELALGGSDVFTVGYYVHEKPYVEATVTRCKNGAVVNYADVYMRRRDPDCLIIGDDKPTDKPRFKERFGRDFEPVRKETFEWLKEQELILVPVIVGGGEYGYPAALIAPKNAGFFACGLADLQYFCNINEYEGIFEPKVIIYLAPPFRHTHFDGKQIVIHNRLDEVYELLSYNLYPGPSAKKGIYGFLLDIGEREGWVTVHTSAVKLVTPYDNEIVMMHEGASGGGKSEMSEHVHREPDGRLLVGQNLETNEKFFLRVEEPCELHPVADDMALCHPKMQNDSKKLVIKDVEAGWFVRVDHIKEYGTDPHLEKSCIQPDEPLIFMSMQAQPNSTVLIWEHIIDEDTNKPCPNPRVVMPRRLITNIVNDPVEVDIRSFGVRTPPCTRERPTYGIMGLMHILPPALGWLWRLVAPRGHANPSIVETEGMTSEGIGSYGYFLTGSVVNQANLLLEQVLSTPNTRYVLLPNQHIGCYKVGFMPQWIAREYIARRGSAKFKPDNLSKARCDLLGYCLGSLKVDGQFVPKAFLQPEKQPEIGLDGYDKGAKILSAFFKKELAKFDKPELNPIGKKILDCAMNDAPLQDYINIIPIKF
ncbi:MAG: DUF4914 family protein [Oscillospiraceae bacterium]|jgi:hypothetical protein|nr:DUF4914 family protein [Oscillospiraceae bacterium]